MRDNPVLRTCAKILFAPIIVFGLYVQFHGDYSPGGGFQAGVIIAAAFILHALIFGLEAGRKLVPGTVSTKLLDGTRLCLDFQKGSCPNGPECPKGAHKCGIVLKNGRVCGMANHSANNCRNMRK